MNNEEDKDINSNDKPPKGVGPIKVRGHHIARRSARGFFNAKKSSTGKFRCKIKGLSHIKKSKKK